MRKITLLTTALALVLAVPTATSAQEGKGRGHGRDHAAQNDRGPPARGPDRDEARGGDDRGPSYTRVEAPRADPPGRGSRDDRREDDRREVRADVRRDLGRGAPRPNHNPPLYLRTAPDRGLIAGCPPGLAMKNNGCLPPGQARKLDRSRYDYLWRTREGSNWRYDDGYLYRLSPQGSVLGYLPALGGALALGNPWPAQYGYEAAPAYYVDYFGLNDRYDYRYADGILYGLDPETRAISQVAALLTGQQWNVGQPMPVGYDVYNVPYPYRSQYVDTSDRWYRYNDGYVYQVDPTTQLVQAVIQLLA